MSDSAYATSTTSCVSLSSSDFYRGDFDAFETGGTAAGGDDAQVLVKRGGLWKVVAYHNVDVKRGVSVPETRRND